jgi:hypothetical protein
LVPAHQASEITQALHQALDLAMSDVAESGRYYSFVVKKRNQSRGDTEGSKHVVPFGLRSIPCFPRKGKHRIFWVPFPYTIIVDQVKN